MTPDTSAAPPSRRANLVGSLTTAALLVLMTLSGALYLASPAPLLRAVEPLGYPASDLDGLPRPAPASDSG